MRKKQLTAVPSIPSSARTTLKAIFTLYGEKDSGKTATLRYLCHLLYGSNASIVLNSHFKDFRISFDYPAGEGCIRIMISTIGDAFSDVQDNWDWFLGIKTLPSGGNHRPCVDIGVNSADKVIVISPTHVTDPGAMRNDQYIISLKHSVSFIHYIRKNKLPRMINGIVSPKDWDVLLGPCYPGKNKWTDGMALDVISAAHAIKEQIDSIIKYI